MSKTFWTVFEIINQCKNSKTNDPIENSNTVKLERKPRHLWSSAAQTHQCRHIKKSWNCNCNPTRSGSHPLTFTLCLSLRGQIERELILYDSSTEWAIRPLTVRVLSLPSRINPSWTWYLWCVHVQQVL